MWQLGRNNRAFARVSNRFPPPLGGRRSNGPATSLEAQGVYPTHSVALEAKFATPAGLGWASPSRLSSDDFYPNSSAGAPRRKQAGRCGPWRTLAGGPQQHSGRGPVARVEREKTSATRFLAREAFIVSAALTHRLHHTAQLAKRETTNGGKSTKCTHSLRS